MELSCTGSDTSCCTARKAPGHDDHDKHYDDNGDLLVRHLVAFLRPATLLIWDLFAHFFWSPVSRLAIGRLRLCAVGVVLGLAVLNLLAVVPVFCLAALLWNLLAVVEVDSPALLSWDEFTIFLLLLGRVFFLPSITFLAFLPLHITVLLHVHLPALLVGNLVAGGGGHLVALDVLHRPAFLLRNLKGEVAQI